MLFKCELLSLVSLSFFAVISDTTWGNIISGLVAIALAWITMQAKTAATSAETAAHKAVAVGSANATEIKEVKSITSAVARQGNSSALIQLEMYEVLAKQLAEKTDSTQMDIDLYERAKSAVAAHKAAQIKVDEEAKQGRDDARRMSQTSIDATVQAAVIDERARVEATKKTI